MKKERNFFLVSVLIVICLFMYQASKSLLEASILNQNSENQPTVTRHFVFDKVPMNLEEVADSADRIFVGKCTDIEKVDNDSESKLSVMRFKFKIIEGIKGTKNEEIISFKQWQPTVREVGYKKGSKYILFLYPNSAVGLTTPVGFQYGHFRVEKKGFLNPKEIVINGYNNLGLTRNLKTRKTVSIKDDSYVDEYLRKCSEKGLPVRYQEFVKAIKYLVKK